MTARHHTVPQFYLRNFADELGQLVLTDRGNPSLSHRTSVRNAVAETGFYRIETEDLARAEDRESFEPESIEAALSALESEMAPAIRTLVEGRYSDFTDEQWYRVVQFVAVQSVRGHRWRNDFTALATQSVRRQVLNEMDEAKAAATLAEQGRPSHPAAVQDFLREIASGRFPRILPPQAVLVQGSLKMALGNPDGANRGIGEHIANKKPELILPRETAVLTSDEPVVWWRPGDDPVGYASARVVWVPLSPRLIVQFRDIDLDLTAHGLPDPRARSSHDELATFVNRLVAAQAERWVIHRPGDAPLDDVRLPAREVWGDELVGVREEGDERRELYVHRRLPG